MLRMPERESTIWGTSIVANVFLMFSPSLQMTIGRPWRAVIWWRAFCVFSNVLSRVITRMTGRVLSTRAKGPSVETI